MRIEQLKLKRNKPNAIGYARVSTKGQVTYGFAGCDDQAERIAKYAKAAGFNLLRVERDEGVSGAEELDRRYGLPLALADIEDGDAAILIVCHQDRLARGLAIQETLIMNLEKVGAQVHSIDQGGSISSEDDDADQNRVFIRQIMGALAQLEKAQIRARCLRGKRAKKAKDPNAYLGGPAPYGTKSTRGSGVLSPAYGEADYVEIIVKLRRNGLSYRAIDKELQAQNCHPRTGTTWHPVTLKRICERAGITNGEGTSRADH